MRAMILSIIAILAASPASAQVTTFPGRTWIGDPIVDQHRYQMDLQRQRSAEQATFARQSRLNARLTEQEVRAQRQPEPFIPLVEVTTPSPELARQTRDRATTAREATAAGVSQIDAWLDRGPR